jgi:putative intracellular protease/amidase
MDGVEQVELTEPRKAFEDAGAATELVSIKPGQIKGWNHTEWGEMFKVDNTSVVPTKLPVTREPIKVFARGSPPVKKLLARCCEPRTARRWVRAVSYHI